MSDIILQSETELCSKYSAVCNDKLDLVSYKSENNSSSRSRFRKLSVNDFRIKTSKNTQFSSKSKSLCLFSLKYFFWSCGKYIFRNLYWKLNPGYVPSNIIRLADDLPGEIYFSTRKGKDYN